MADMHTDQIDVYPKNRPVQARLAFAYVHIIKSRLVNWFIIGIGILNQLNTLYICEIICLTLHRIMSIDWLNETTTQQGVLKWILTQLLGGLSQTAIFLFKIILRKNQRVLQLLNGVDYGICMSPIASFSR